MDSMDWYYPKHVGFRCKREVRERPLADDTLCCR
jgi:hypothetical protein